jgi:hypothetical protein
VRFLPGSALEREGQREGGGYNVRFLQWPSYSLTREARAIKPRGPSRSLENLPGSCKAQLRPDPARLGPSSLEVPSAFLVNLPGSCKAQLRPDPREARAIKPRGPPRSLENLPGSCKAQLRPNPARLGPSSLEVPSEFLVLQGSVIRPDPREARAIKLRGSIRVPRTAGAVPKPVGSIQVPSTAG